MGGLQTKSMMSQRYRAVTRWQICVTMATLWQQQDGGYALLFYIFNSTVIDWTCFFFFDLGTRRGWGVSVTSRPHLTPGKDPVPLVQEAGWASGPVWTGAENLAPTGIRSLDCPACRQSFYQLRYPAHYTVWLQNEWRNQKRTKHTQSKWHWIKDVIGHSTY